MHAFLADVPSVKREQATGLLALARSGGSRPDKSLRIVRSPASKLG